MSDQNPNASRAQAPARIGRLTDHQVDNLSDSTTATERVAMVAVLSQRMWELSGRPFPSYSRAAMPVRVVRLG